MELQGSVPLPVPLHKGLPLVHTWFTSSKPISLGFTAKLASFLCLHLQSNLLPLRFPTKTPQILVTPILATYPAHRILIDLIILIFGEEQKFCDSCLCSFSYPPSPLQVFSLSSCSQNSLNPFFA